MSEPYETDTHDAGPPVHVAVVGHDQTSAAVELRYDGGLTVGDLEDNHVAVERAHDRCVTYCLGERQPVQRRRGQRCPSCYGKVGIRAMDDGEDIPPAGSRFAWLTGYWLGGWAAAWHDATVGMTRKNRRARDEDTATQA